MTVVATRNETHSHQRPHLFRMLKVVTITFFIVIIPLLTLIGTHRQFSEFSPIDEGAHYDYVKRIYSHGIPIMGDVMLMSSLNDISCYGVALDGLVLPPCDSNKVVPEAFPGGGLQYEAQQPPAYYFYAATVSPAFDLFGFGALGALRATGLLLIIGANFALYRASRLLKIPLLLFLPALGVLNFAPVVAYHQSIVSNDAAVLPIASLIAYLVARNVTNRHTSTIWWIIVGLLAGLTKGTLLIACGVAFLFTLIWSFPSNQSLNFSTVWRKTTRHRYIQQVGLLAISAGVSTGIWSVFVTSTTKVPLNTLAPFDVLRGGAVSIQLIMRQALVGFSPLTQSFAPYNGLGPDSMAVINFVVNTSLITACAAGVFVATRTWWRVAGPVILIVQYLGTLALGISIWRTYDMDPGLSSRYGLAATPFIILILCAGIRRYFAQIIFACAASIVALLYAINIFAST